MATNRNSAPGWCKGPHTLRLVGQQRTLFGKPSIRLYDHYACTRKTCEYEKWVPAQQQEETEE